MNEQISGLYYDGEEALAFIVDHTGYEADTVRAVYDAYYHGDGDNSGLDYVEPFSLSPAELEPKVSNIAGRLNVSPYIVARVLAEDVGYTVSRGIMDEGAYPYFLEWAGDRYQRE